MPRLEICKDCEYNDDFYGCTLLDDCEVYQDVKADREYEDWRDDEER